MIVRRVLVSLVALVAVSGIGAPAALGGDAADPAAPMRAEAAPAQPPTAGTTAGESPAPTAPAPADPAPSEATPTDAAPSDPETTGPGSSDPGPSGPVASDAGPVDPGPAPVDSAPDSSGPSPGDAPASATLSPTTSPETSQDAASAPGPAQDSARDDVQQQSRAGDPPAAGETQQMVAVAHNRSLVFQVVWQVQLGCRTHCRGTSQSQFVIQWASTTQSANATAGSAEPGTPGSYPAEAYNTSLTVQFVWQLQIGCVAFCYETSQTQSASQWAETIQTAIAEGGIAGVALNLSQTLQYVLQIQQACEYECYGVYQSQTSSQAHATTQSARAKAHAPVTMLVRGNQSPPPSPPAVGKDASKLPTKHVYGGSRLADAPANHTQQPPFNLALALEPMSPDDAANWRTIALLAAALALLTLLVAFARRSPFLKR